MRKYILTAALVAVGLPMAPAMARQTNGYTVRTTVMRAGPDRDYPAVQRLRRNSNVVVYGCLRNWSWCDVSNRYDRGWVARRDLVVYYQGRQRTITSTMGIGILSFMFGSYWDSHYRSRPFYSERPRWEQQYNNNYRQEWGTRPRMPQTQQYQPGAGIQPRITPQRQTVPHRVITPTVPHVTPQGQGAVIRQQHIPVQRQQAPTSQGQHQAPGQLKKNDQHGQLGQDRKSHD